LDDPAADLPQRCDRRVVSLPGNPVSCGDNVVIGSAPTSPGRATPGVMPGTELAFERDVVWDRPFSFFRRRLVTGRLARFRRVDPDNRHAHHDAVEFPDGRTVLLTMLRAGQRATVVQLPVRRESAQTATFGSSAAANPRVRDIGNVVVVSTSPSRAGRDETLCKL
jgi:hypothetical protein